MVLKLDHMSHVWVSQIQRLVITHLSRRILYVIGLVFTFGKFMFVGVVSGLWWASYYRKVKQLFFTYYSFKKSVLLYLLPSMNNKLLYLLYFYITSSEEMMWSTFRSTTAT